MAVLGQRSLLRFPVRRSSPILVCLCHPCHLSPAFASLGSGVCGSRSGSASSNDDGYVGQDSPVAAIGFESLRARRFNAFDVCQVSFRAWAMRSGQSCESGWHLFFSGRLMPNQHVTRQTGTADGAKKTGSQQSAVHTTTQ